MPGVKELLAIVLMILGAATGSGTSSGRYLASAPVVFGQDRAVSFDLPVDNVSTLNAGGKKVVVQKKQGSLLLSYAGKDHILSGSWAPHQKDRVHVEYAPANRHHSAMLSVQNWRTRVNGSLSLSANEQPANLLQTPPTPILMVAHRLLEINFRLPRKTCWRGSDNQGQVRRTPAGGYWGCGFFADSLWQADRLIPNSIFSDLAWKRTLEVAGMRFGVTHDVGYIYRPVLMALRTRCRNPAPEDVQHCLWLKDRASAHARVLAGLARPSVAHMVASGRDGKRAIIDQLGNLDLLRWYADRTGQDVYQRMADRATRSAGQHLIRRSPRWGVWQESFFKNHKLDRLSTLQGAKPNGVWSRGQSWAVMGFARAAKTTPVPRDLRTFRLWSEKTGLFMLAHLTRQGLVPWDLSRPATDPPDQSATLIASQGMSDLADLCQNGGCIRPSDFWAAKACSLLRHGWLDQARTIPPLGLTLRGVGTLSRDPSYWENDAELPFSLDYALQAWNDLNGCRP